MKRNHDTRSVHRGSVGASSRAGFVVSPMLVLIAAVLGGLVIWKTKIQLDHIPADYPGAAALKSKMVTGGTTAFSLLLSIAGGIGACCYFASGKSHRAAQAGMSVVLALGVGVFSIQLYRYYAYGAAAVTQQSATSTPASAPKTSDAMSELAEQMKADAERTRAAREQMRKEMDQAMERTRALAEGRPQPIVPPAPAASNPNPSAPTPRPAAPVPPSTKPTDPAITKALDELKADVDKQVGEFVDKAKALTDSVDKPPPRSMPVMDKRVADARQLKADAAALSKRLHGLDTEAEKKLGEVGIDKMAGMHERVRFTMDYKGPSRAFACDEYGRMCDDIIAESELLKRGFNNWKYDASGNISSKDKHLEFEARSIRNRLEGALGRADELAGRVRGG